MKKQPPSSGHQDGHPQQHNTPDGNAGTGSLTRDFTGDLQAEGIRVLFVGRRSASVEEVETRLAASGDSGSGNEGGRTGIAGEEAAVRVNGQVAQVRFVLLTNQRVALRHIRRDPPEIVLVEIDEKPNSRARFCEMLRYRLPTAHLLAVGYEQPQGDVEFDGFLQMPLTVEKVFGIIEETPDSLSGHEVACGPIHLNVVTRTVHTPNGKHHMTPKQCALLQMLMERHNVVVSRREIMASIWDTSYLEDTRTLDVHVRWLRERIEPNPSTPVYLITVRGEGYMLSIPADGSR